MVVGVFCEVKRCGVEVFGDIVVLGFGGFEILILLGFDLIMIVIFGYEIGVVLVNVFFDFEMVRVNKIIDVGYSLIVC